VKLPTFDGLSIKIGQDKVDTSKVIIQPSEREKFIRIFHASHPENGTLDAEKAKRVFSRSKLPVDTLAHIWSLADTRKSGTLNQTEFVIAMYYIARSMEGNTDIPQALPPAIYAAAAGRTASTNASPQVRHSVAQIPRQSTGPQAMAASPVQPVARQFTGASSAFSPMLSRSNTISPSLPPNSNKWIISPDDRRKYDGFFEKLDVGKLGFIQGADAVEFFQNSRLPDTDLAHIWDLSDRHERGRLSKDEFAIAMYLIHKRLKGDLLPTILPPSLLVKTATPEMSASTSDMTIVPTPTFVQSPPAATHSLIDDGHQFRQFETQPSVAEAASEVEILKHNVNLAEQEQAKLKNDHVSLDEQLKSLQKENAELRDHLSQLHDSDKQVKATVAKLKDQLETEREQLQQARDDAKRATEELDAIRAQKQEIDKEIESNRLESSRLRKDLFAKQEQSNRLRRELEKLGAFIKKDRMMLDITRRQSSAADSEIEKLSTALDKAKSGTPIEEVSESPQTSPRLSQDPSTTTDLSASPETIAPRQAASPAQRTKAAPPPPPPSSRHHLSAQEEKRNSSSASGKKPPAPPPAARSKSKTDLSTAAAATAVAVTGVAAGLALEHASNDGFSNSDPFDDFTRTFEAAKESNAPSDFDEVFGDQPTSPFAPFPEQQSFSTGFDDDFATPASNATSTQPLVPGEADLADAVPESSVPEVSVATSAVQSTRPDESDADQTESASQSESESDSESTDEDEDEIVNTHENERNTETEPGSHGIIGDVAAAAAASVAAIGALVVPDEQSTADQKSVSDQPTEASVDDQHVEPLESQAANNATSENDIVSDDTTTLPNVPLVSQEDKAEEKEDLLDNKKDDSELKQPVVDSVVPASESLSADTDTISNSMEPKEVDDNQVVPQESLTPTADQITVDQNANEAIQVDQVSTDHIPPDEGAETDQTHGQTPKEHVINEESPVEHQPVEGDDTAHATLSEIAPAATSTLYQPTAETQQPDVHSQEHVEPLPDQSAKSTVEEKPDHDFEVIDPVSSTSSFVSDGMTVSMEQEQEQEEEQSPFDDFESAFSGNMSEAKVIPANSNTEFEAPFDAAFEDEFNPTFDHPQNTVSSTAAASQSPSEAAAFADSFNFENSAFENALSTSPTTTTQTDLDSAFHLDVPEDTSLPKSGDESPYLHSGFSSFASALEGSSVTPTDRGTPSAAESSPFEETHPPSSTIDPADDLQHSHPAANPNPTPAQIETTPIQPAAHSPAISEPHGLHELLNMGFSREQAVDALRRYDNDLEKATNFLLDN
jgi:hypothetical protein